MNKQTMRAFAFGLFAASLALFIYKESPDSSQLTEKDMIEKLEEQQYTVWTAVEAAKQQQEKEQLQQELNRLTNQEKKAAAKDAAKKTTDTKKSYNIKIEPGMSSSEIGRLLEEARMIENSEILNLYLTENGYAEKLQVGEHTIHPSMTMKEMAVVLTTK
ncbi:hypothetical protein F9802_01045 [Bacillus aerolatus]|uniref:Endolytic transglycosylase MltG n=1 Tax=Bacillus aerolatus TaxID=2653354 RepID=A0A6I1FNC4_9BACI|nr:endolytic transglycosylase MltG [Bacillus aerolatus]KAB7708767.1 hypothetical protein F9802_01045 [Bacillus aerolatus]